MSFLTLILKNLWRQKIRNLLTLLGVSIGVATILSLGLVMNGFEQSLGATIRSGKTDFTVVNAQAPAILFSVIDESKLREIEEFEGVKQAVGVLFSLARFESNPYFLLIGLAEPDLDFMGVHLIEGRTYHAGAEDEILLGRTAASSAKARVGENVSISGRTFRVVGIFETGNVWEDGGAFLPRSTLQSWQRRTGELSMILVQAHSEDSAAEVARRIEEHYAYEWVTMRSVAESEKVVKSLGIMRAVSWAVSILAVGIGGIGVMNTMIMAVYERTREIGILRAVGWRRRRVLSLILGESLLIALLAAGFGFGVGVLAVQSLLLFPWVKGLIAPAYSVPLFLQSLGIALGVGFLGGLYPAYRASRITPTVALRYE
jgi:putative ABC transport system permease protein